MQLQEPPFDLKGLKGFLSMILFVVGGTFIGVGIANLCANAIPLFWTMEGEGRVVQKINRSGENSGLWVKFEDGTEIRFPPTQLWENVHLRDYIRKKKYSAIYTINNVEHNMFIYLVQTWLSQWLFFSLLLSIVFTWLWFTRIARNK